MRPAVIVALVTFLVAPLRADTGFIDRTVTIGGSTYRYQVYVPPEYDPREAHPVIVDLHGNGMQGSDGLLQTVVGLADQVRKDRSRFPCIVIFPQAQENTLWLNPEMEDLVVAELDQVMAEFRVDADRVYLMGFSMGATGAYRIAFRWPDRFAAMVTVAGRIEPAEDYGPTIIAIDRKANPFVTSADPFATLAGRLRQLPISVVHGDADDIVPVQQSRSVVAALKRAGSAVRYIEYAGVDHAGAARKAYTEQDTLDWLLAQRRSP